MDLVVCIFSMDYFSPAYYHAVVVLLFFFFGRQTGLWTCRIMVKYFPQFDGKPSILRLLYGV